MWHVCSTIRGQLSMNRRRQLDSSLMLASIVPQIACAVWKRSAAAISVWRVNDSLSRRPWHHQQHSCQLENCYSALLSFRLCTINIHPATCASNVNLLSTKWRTDSGRCYAVKLRTRHFGFISGVLVFATCRIMHLKSYKTTVQHS